MEYDRKVSDRYPEVVLRVKMPMEQLFQFARRWGRAHGLFAKVVKIHRNSRSCIDPWEGSSAASHPRSADYMGARKSKFLISIKLRDLAKPLLETHGRFKLESLL
jgi:hypothetical protein